jgi:hypothetical protein
MDIHRKILAPLKTIIIKNQTFMRKQFYRSDRISLESQPGSGQLALP